MGGEGAPWIGMAPFVDHQHIFQNIGDGTFFHSGSPGREACVAAGVNITYKILYNGHVAMTGGQEARGALADSAADARSWKPRASARPWCWRRTSNSMRMRSLCRSNAELRDRDELPRTSARAGKVPGRDGHYLRPGMRRRKAPQAVARQAAEPTLRLVINEEVCEGCGDCVKQSNCMSLLPGVTDSARRRAFTNRPATRTTPARWAIARRSSRVKIKQGTGSAKRPLPQLPSTDVAAAPREGARRGADIASSRPGIGGTGVVTINALLATAAWIDGCPSLTLDQTGIAQKGGAVVSSVILSEQPIETASSQSDTAMPT